YQTLLQELKFQENSTLQTHHTCMNYLNISLDTINKPSFNRVVIGLSKTSTNTVTGKNSYIDELHSPFAPEKFFKDAMLSELLYHQLGKNKCESLKKLYHHRRVADVDNEITTSFVEAFQTFQPIFDNIDQAIDSSTPDSKIKRVDHIDFSW